jgi:hypothetical protein
MLIIPVSRALLNCISPLHAASIKQHVKKLANTHRVTCVTAWILIWHSDQLQGSLLNGHKEPWGLLACLWEKLLVC